PEMGVPSARRIVGTDLVGVETADILAHRELPAVAEEEGLVEAKREPQLLRQVGWVALIEVPRLRLPRRGMRRRGRRLGTGRGRAADPAEDEHAGNGEAARPRAHRTLHDVLPRPMAGRRASG